MSGSGDQDQTLFRAIIDAATDSVFAKDLEFRYTFANPAMERLLGLTAAEIVGHTPVEIFGEESGRIIDEVDRLTLERGRADEVRQLNIGGRDYYFHTLQVLLPGNGGQPGGICGFVRDVTKGKRAESRLRENEAKYRALFQSNAFLTYITDMNGTILLANERGAAFMDQTIESIQGTSFFALRPDRAEMYRGVIERIRQTGEPLRFETIFPTPEEERWLDVHISPIQIGDEILLQIVSREITEQKQAEEELRRQARVLHDSQQVARLGSYELDIPSGLWRSTDMLNRIFGIDGTEAHTIDDWQNLLHPEFREEMMRYFSERVVGRGERFDREYRIVRRDTGEARWVHGLGELEFDESGRPVRMVGTIADITERKRLEAEGLRAQKLESVGVLAGGIAHDFNNLLTSILANVQMVRMQLDARRDLRELLLESERACQRANDLTKQLLTFSRGGEPVTQTESLAGPLADWARFALRGSQAKLAVEIAEDLLPVEVDGGQLSQVINNLAINADQAMPEGGEIVLRAENLPADYPIDQVDSTLAEGRYIRIAVIDRGVGIPTEAQTRVFDPYFTTKATGNGLGLATSYSIVRNHRGALRVRSQVGVGSTFEIFLPVSDKAPVDREKTPVAAIDGKGRILLMDDNRHVRRAAANILKSLGYSVDQAEDGVQAETMYREALAGGRRYDATILDLTVPGGMGGEQTLERLRALDPEVRAIVSSGYADNPVLSRYRDYGFCGMIPKPFGIEELAQALAEALGQTESG